MLFDPEMGTMTAYTHSQTLRHIEVMFSTLSKLTLFRPYLENGLIVCCMNNTNTFSIAIVSNSNVYHSSRVIQFIDGIFKALLVHSPPQLIHKHMRDRVVQRYVHIQIQNASTHTHTHMHEATTQSLRCVTTRAFAPLVFTELFVDRTE